jgi:Dolichyl-phosphate-mannose-protein mannosyltransferase
VSTEHATENASEAKPSTVYVYGAASLAALTFASRLWVSHHYRGEAVWDGHYYDYYAKRIAQGFGYSDALGASDLTGGRPSCHYPVGYSALLGLFYRLFGESSATAQFLNALVAAGITALVFSLARRWLGPIRATGAACLVIAHPGLCLYSALTMSELLATVLTLLAFWFAQAQDAAERDQKTSREPRLRNAVLACLTLGFATLVRPPALFTLPFLFSASTYRLALQALLHSMPKAIQARLTTATNATNATASVGHSKRLLRTLMVYSAGTLLALTVVFLPIVPWSLRNCKQMDGCALVSTNGGWNLAIGAFPRATGRFETLRSSDGCREVTGQVQQDRCWMKVGLGYVYASPTKWLALAPKKWAYTFDHESFPVEYLHEAAPEAWPEPRRNDMRQGITTFHRYLMVVAALGLVTRSPWQRGKALWRDAAWLACVVAIGCVGYWGLQKPEPTVWLCALLGMVQFAFMNGYCLVQRVLLERENQEHASKPLPPALPAGGRLAFGLLFSVYLTHMIFFGEDRYHMVASPVLCLLTFAFGKGSTMEDQSVNGLMSKATVSETTANRAAEATVVGEAAIAD